MDMIRPGIPLYSFLILLFSAISCTATAAIDLIQPAETRTVGKTAVTKTPTATFTPFQPSQALSPPAGTATAEPTPEPPASPVTEAAEAAERAAAPANNDIPRADVPIRLELIAEGLATPVDLASPPDGSGRLFTVDLTGVISVIGADGEMRQEPFLDLRKWIAPSLEGSDRRGLQALVFHTQFAQNGRFFVYYSAPLRDEGPDGWDHTGRLSEFKVSHWNNHVADPESEQVLLEVDQPHAGHEGVQLALRPDGNLNLKLGLGGDAREGAVHCFDLEPDSASPMTCPPGSSDDNPSLDLLRTYASMEVQDGSPAGQAASSGRVYQGLAFPSFQGRLIFAGWTVSDGPTGSRLFIATLPHDEDQVWTVEELPIANRETGRLGELIHAIGQGAAGELYVLTSENPASESGTGKVYKIIPHIQPERSVVEDPREYLPMTHRYARVVRRAPIYRNLDDVRANDPFDTHGGGSFWVSERNQAQVGGRTYYRVSWGWGMQAWISANDIRFDAPLSHLQGVNLRQRAGEPLAMVYRAVYVRSLPGVITDETIIATLQPYDLVTVLETRKVDGVVWYRIGPDQWSHSDYLRVFVPGRRPAEVGANEKWVEVNLSEQVVIAHEGDRPVFATLTSTGRRGYATEMGLFRGWAYLREGPMQWLAAELPYSLANVPWIMYFNGSQGLHGTYWHDLLGSVRSAGCVNLSPHDANWLFHWADTNLAPGQRIKYPDREEPGIWVWVHDGQPDLGVVITAYRVNTLGWPETTRPLE